MTRAREIADLAGLVTSDSTSIAWDTSTLYIDATNNRVGVLTASPTKALDLRGSLGVGNSTAVYTSLDPVATNDSNGGFSLSTLTSSSLTEKARLTSTGRLGIGTTSPDTLLHIKSTDNAGVTLESTDGSRKWLIRNNQGTNDGLVLRNATAGTDVVIIDDGAGANSLVVDSSGNVAIGGTDADVTLDMSAKNDAIHLPTGNTSQRPSAAEAGMFRYNSETSQFEGYTNAWGAIAGGGGVDSAAVRNIFSVSGDLAYDSAIGQFSFDASTTFSADTFTGDDSTAAFTLSQTVSSENHLIVFNEGVFQNQSAYVLSGTTLTFDSAPASGNTIVAYQVKNAIFGNNLNLNQFTGDDSTAAFTLSLAPIHENNTQVYIDGVYQQKNGYTTSGTTLTFDTAPPTGSTIEVMTMTQTDINTAKILQDGDLDTKIQVEESTDEDKIRFDIAGTEKMIIDSTGVGIGTSSPSGRLHLNTNGLSNGIIIEGNDNDNVKLKFDNNGTGGEEWQIQVGQQGASNAGFHIRSNTASANRFTIDSSGNVGIGTSSPSSKLDIVSSGTNSQVLGKFSSASGVRAVINTDAQDDGYLYLYDATDTVKTAFRTDGNDSYIAGGGNFGIGTSSPLTHTNGFTLTLGNGSTTHQPYLKFNRNSTGGYWAGIKWNHSGTEGAAIDEDADKHLRFSTNGLERMRILAGGGLTFNGDTASANALDDYEEGTWTPSLTGGTYTTSYLWGYYTKVGNLVSIRFGIKLSSWTATSGGVTVTGMPFNTGNIAAYSHDTGCPLVVLKPNSKVWGVGADTSALFFRQLDAINADAQMGGSDVDADTAFVCSMVYRTS